MMLCLSQQEGAQALCRSVKDGTPFIAGKIGTSEFEALLTYLQRKKYGLNEYPEHVRNHMGINAGFFPANTKALDEWAEHMLTKVLPEMDYAVEWNPAYSLMEKSLFDSYAKKAKRIRLRSLEPYYEDDVENRWTYMLNGTHMVAIISPFSVSISNQWPLREDLWLKRPLWSHDPPKIVPIQCGYGPMLTKRHGWPLAILESGWKAAVRYIVDKVVGSGAQFAIIGCGALSLPLAYALKQAGISAIHTGGATQILFGIKGRRWISHEVISTFFNDSWASPLPLEIPTEASRVEGGCYW
jgi:hypothetical protein